MCRFLLPPQSPPAIGAAAHRPARPPGPRPSPPRRRPLAVREREEHRVVLAAVREALLGLDVVQALRRAHVAELVALALLVAAPDARDDEARRAREPLDVVEVLGRAERDDLLLEPLGQLLHLAVERPLVARVRAGLDGLG